MCERIRFWAVLMVVVVVGPALARIRPDTIACLGSCGLFTAVPTVEFESDASGNVEVATPSLLEVVLSEAQDVPVTVDYAVAGGTAATSVDYSLAGCCAYDFDRDGEVNSRDLKSLADNWLSDAAWVDDGAVDFEDFAVFGLEWATDCMDNTLRFLPGQTSKTIYIDIVSDGVNNEPDETIIMELSNPVGGQVQLGAVNRHTYTIIDTLPEIAFETEFSQNLEKSSAAQVCVKLSRVSGQVATVDYAVTGGSAVGNGVDYSLRDGTLTFNPGETSKLIGIRLRNDDEIEADSKTIVVGLSNPTNATLGSTTQHTVTILDDDAGVWFDDLHWFHSHDIRHLWVNGQGHLEWDVDKGGQFITRIPTQDLSDPGDKVEISYWWMTDGQHNCPSCTACPDGCYDDDITCIAGTSDFRVGLFQADGEYVTRDGLDTHNDIFDGYKGYNFRFGPNMKSGPNRWVDCTGEVHKTGNFTKKPAGLENLLSSNDGFMDYIDGFELPPGQWSLFTLRLERLSSDRVRLSITLNGRTQSDTDSSSRDQPRQIDVFAVHMRNGRPYSRLVLAKERPSQ